MKKNFVFIIIFSLFFTFVFPIRAYAGEIFSCSISLGFNVFIDDVYVTTIFDDYATFSNEQGVDGVLTPESWTGSSHTFYFHLPSRVDYYHFDLMNYDFTILDGDERFAFSGFGTASGDLLWFTLSNLWYPVVMNGSSCRVIADVFLYSEISVTPTPIPTYNPRPTSIPTNTPVPNPTNTPVPRPTNTPVPRPTNTPVPRPTNTPVPLVTFTPTPTMGPTPFQSYEISNGITKATFSVLNPNGTDIGYFTLEKSSIGNLFTYTFPDLFYLVSIDPLSFDEGGITIDSVHYGLNSSFVFNHHMYNYQNAKFNVVGYFVTPTPRPTNTPVPRPSNTPVPRPTNTPVPLPPQSTPIPTYNPHVTLSPSLDFDRGQPIEFDNISELFGNVSELSYLFVTPFEYIFSLMWDRWYILFLFPIVAIISAFIWERKD